MKLILNGKRYWEIKSIWREARCSLPIRKRKINKMKYAQILFLLLIFSCHNTETGNQISKDEISFFDEQFSYTSNEPILNIYCKFSECGEWGGHEEHIIISKKNKKSFKLNYEKYSANCDSIVQVFDGIGYLIEPKSKLIESREIEIQEKEKRAILDFSYKMVKSKFMEEYPGHAGLILSITNSDSTFMISTYGGKADHFLKLLSELELEK